jgi:hypothetical protein
MELLTLRKYFVLVDEGWSGWDVKIARGLWSRAFLLVCTEDHGQRRHLQRVRCDLRLSRLSGFVLRCYAGAAAVALIAGQPGLGVLIGAAGLGHFAYIVRETLRFGRIMHQVIEQVAGESGLIPIPLADRR